jgi:hypothetical protein
MDAAYSKRSPGAGRSPAGFFPTYFGDAIRYWEPRRVVYNLGLMAVTAGWFVATWPHFRPALTRSSLLILSVLALLANVCYCAAYLVDIPMQFSALNRAWKRRRWMLWLIGTLCAFVLTNYWIADEIYPYVR